MGIIPIVMFPFSVFLKYFNTSELGCWVSVIGTATTLRTGPFGVQTPVGARDFLFTTPSRMVPWPTQPPVQWAPGLIPEGKAYEAWRWPPSLVWYRGWQWVQLCPHGMSRAKLYFHCWTYMHNMWNCSSRWIHTWYCGPDTGQSGTLVSLFWMSTLPPFPR